MSVFTCTTELFLMQKLIHCMSSYKLITLMNAAVGLVCYLTTSLHTSMLHSTRMSTENDVPCRR